MLGLAAVRRRLLSAPVFAYADGEAAKPVAASWSRSFPVTSRLATVGTRNDRRVMPDHEHWGVPSPGGWTPPVGVLAAWNWTPPGGLRPRLERIPRWVRVWYRLPFIDRYAHAWMWRHGGWDVDAASGFAGPDVSGVREPRRPHPTPVLGSAEQAIEGHDPGMAG